ncbi:MAG: MbnH family di-heme enzyme [Thermoanaerobaculia bacterium]
MISRGGRARLSAAASTGLAVLAVLTVVSRSRSAAAAEAAPPAPGSAAHATAAPTFDWHLPTGFPTPVVPADDPITEQKVALGRHLFYDPRLSGNGTQACASCHAQERAFTDGRARALGSTGAVHPRSSMSLANAAYAVSLTWADPARTRLEEQAVIPLRNTKPVEMGALGHEGEVLERLRADARYRSLFSAAFPGSTDPFSIENVTRAVASFERTLISGRSPYDALVWHGERNALSADAWRGMKLFFDERLACSTCHAGFTFSGPATWAGALRPRASFQNNGLASGIEGADPGLFAVSHRASDRGRFRAPTLRNIAVTAPYMHDGRLPTLESVVAHYAGGGTPGPNRSPLVRGFEITPQQSCDLVAFLESLTDAEFLADARFSNPWNDTKRSLDRSGELGGREPDVLEPLLHPLSMRAEGEDADARHGASLQLCARDVNAVARVRARQEGAGEPVDLFRRGSRTFELEGHERELRLGHDAHARNLPQLLGGP